MSSAGRTEFARPEVQAITEVDPTKNFRFYDNRQKYLMFVNTCREKRVARRILIGSECADGSALLHRQPLSDAGSKVTPDVSLGQQVHHQTDYGTRVTELLRSL